MAEYDIIRIPKNFDEERNLLFAANAIKKINEFNERLDLFSKKLFYDVFCKYKKEWLDFLSENDIKSSNIEDYSYGCLLIYDYKNNYFYEFNSMLGTNYFGECSIDGNYSEIKILSSGDILYAVYHWDWANNRGYESYKNYYNKFWISITEKTIISFETTNPLNRF